MRCCTLKLFSVFVNFRNPDCISHVFLSLLLALNDAESFLRISATFCETKGGSSNVSPKTKEKFLQILFRFHLLFRRILRRGDLRQGEHRHDPLIAWKLHLAVDLREAHSVALVHVPLHAGQLPKEDPQHCGGYKGRDLTEFLLNAFEKSDS